jgi:hypothetical protein
MEFNLPGLLTAPEVTAWAAGIALIVGVIQQLSFIPIPDGSRARAWAVSILAAAIIVLTLPMAGEAAVGQLVLAAVLSWAALASASLGLNRAGSYSVKAVQAGVSGPAVEDSPPTTNTRGDAP